MSQPQPPKPGTIGWMDLTVPDAEGVRAFYEAVAGWTPQPVPMGDYNDYAMIAPGEERAVGGICHARGINTGLPACWLIYITVEDLDARLDLCRELGGEVVVGPRDMGAMGRYAVIRDPAGAAVTLYQFPKAEG